MRRMFDVVVVGAGPGGIVAAKKCAENGLTVLLVEKKKIPREKVCSGMILSQLAQTLIKEEFGEIPKEVLIDRLSGLILWVPNMGERKISFNIPITWRKDLDYWMSKKANEKGVEIWDGTAVKRIFDDGKKCRILLKRKNIEDEIRAKFVIGADGAYSVVRKSIFPFLQITHTTAQRMCYEGRLSLLKNYSYIIFPYQQHRPNFWVNPKGECFTIEGGIRELKNEIKTILAEFGLGERKLLWRDGCINRALLYNYLLSGEFQPAKGNVLLIGDAAGLKNPITGEGIHTAIKSGIFAAESIVKAIKTGDQASKVYLTEIRPLLVDLRSNYSKLEKIKQHEKRTSFLPILSQIFEESIYNL